MKCDHCECVFYENAHLEEHVNNDHKNHWKSLPLEIILDESTSEDDENVTVDKSSVQEAQIDQGW